MAFLLNADNQVYGRYGGRDARGPEDHLSLAGLHYAMAAALDAHRRGSAPPAPRKEPPILAEDYPAARRMHLRGECIHCHQVYEFRRELRQAAGQWSRDEIWVYPPPENVGVTLDRDVGNRVRSVAPGSAAHQAGLRAGDFLQRLNGLPVASFADAQYALHRAPATGRIPVSWLRDGRETTAKLDLAAGWRKTIPTWRPSLLDLLPSLSVYGDDLTAAEKKAIRLGPGRLAFRQQKEIHKDVRTAGVRVGDVVIGIDRQFPEMSMLEFLGYVRKTYLVGDRITLHVLREGKRVDLPMTLR
jgi:hypothetical protein